MLSLLLTLVVFAYAYQKADVLVTKKDVDILSTTNENSFDPDYIFSYNNGFNIAAAFTAYDSNTEIISDDSMGELVFDAFSWDSSILENTVAVR